MDSESETVTKFVLELWSSNAINDEVDGAVENDKKPGEKVEDVGVLADVVFETFFVTEFNCFQQSYFFDADYEAWGVKNEKNSY